MDRGARGLLWSPLLVGALDGCALAGRGQLGWPPQAGAYRKHADHFALTLNRERTTATALCTASKQAAPIAVALANCPLILLSNYGQPA